MARVRVHQHVNPFAPYYVREPEPVEPDRAFAHPARPLHLDLGSARGRFLLQMASVEPEWNFLGVEIREPLVIEANRLAAEAEFGNLHYVFCNAMLWLDHLLTKIPPGRLQMVTIQFPDPWFKKKHEKRRMVNAELIRTLVDRMPIGARVLVQTDIEFLAEEMFGSFRGNTCLKEMAIDRTPFPVKTERERAVEKKGLAIYRAMFERV